MASSDWSSTRIAVLETHQKHKVDDVTVDTAALGSYLRAAGLECTKQQFVAALGQLDPLGQDRIHFPALVRWLKGQCAAQANDRKFNRLLVKAPVGAHIPATYNLPAGAHIYGKKVQRDAVDAHESIYSQPAEGKKRRRSRQLDVVAMNRNAVKRGFTTAREFSQTWSKKLYRNKPRQHSVNRQAPLRGQEDMQFGFIKPEKRASMNALVCGEFYRQSQSDGDEVYPSTTGRANLRRKRAQHMKLKLVKHTKKSHGMMTHRSNLVEQETHRSQLEHFRLRRFQNVKPRVNMTGHLSKSAPVSPVSRAAQSILLGR